jgi:hypothetical protein
MAARAIFSELAPMLVLMTACTFAREPKISSIEIFNYYSTSRGAENEISLVATPARDSRMLPGEHKAGFAMVHGLAVRFPVNDLKIGAVMLRMAGRTIFASAIRFYPHGVHSAPLRYPFADFRMTFQTFQLRGAAAQVMAFGAVRGT